MILRATSYIKICIVLAVMVVSGCSAFEAFAAWNVEVTLKRDTIEDAMIMPSSLFIDKKREQYYVVDSGKNRLLSFNRKGELLHVFTAGGSLERPFDMVRTDNGTIWVVEKERNSLTSIDLKAQKTIPHTLKYKGELVYPHRIETNGDQLYVLDKATGTIIVYSLDLVSQKSFACSDCRQGFFDFKIYDDSVWALDRLGKTVYVFDQAGSVTRKFDLGDNVTYPVSLAVGPSGYLYILDRHSRDVAVYDQDGNYKYSFLQFGIASGQLYYPNEIRFDPWEGLCITDEGNARVEVYRR